ncbi:MAG: hypothetical protein AVDCRST_MAG71-1997, partial [uncultured Lysobacter sp.]
WKPQTPLWRRSRVSCAGCRSRPPCCSACGCCGCSHR